MRRYIMMSLPAAILLVTVAGCDDYRPGQNTMARQQAVWTTYEKQQAEETKRREAAWAQSEDAIKKNRQIQEKHEAMQEREERIRDRQEALLKKQEEQADRFDAILKKWESQSRAAGQ